MSLPAPELTLCTDHLHVSAWTDPVVDLMGHDPRSTYVERFWLPMLGPSTTLLLRRLAAEFDEHPAGFDLPVLDTAKALGLGHRGGRNSPFLRAIARTGQFHLSQSLGHDVLHVRRRLPALNRHQVLRLPPPLRDEHDRWQEANLAEPDLAQRRSRARRLALSLLELGETDEATELQLHRWKVHPALAHEALRWAHLRRGTAAPTSPPAETSIPDPSHVRDGAPTPIPRVRPVPPPAPVAASRGTAPTDGDGPTTGRDPAVSTSWPPTPTGPPPRPALPRPASGDAA